MGTMKKIFEVMPKLKFLGVITIRHDENCGSFIRHLAIFAILAKKVHHFRHLSKYLQKSMAKMTSSFFIL
jgi:hypothetical protein